ncbi:M48 family peptidase [Candidatus Woesearchaeota archaeon]|nr:MAG: M48 family peptidase [Candidatus Woesearchaeota archaeon]
MRNLAQSAYDEFFDGKGSCTVELKYSGRFKGFNANVKMVGSRITLCASKRWKDVSPEIQKGLFHELFARLFQSSKRTLNMELYDNFMRSLPRLSPKTLSHPVLERSFDRVNSLMFGGLMERPNLKVGKGVNQLGLYEYSSDTVTISEILLPYPDLMDYVMYHELLHKKHQFKRGARRTTHHSKAFREDEAKFPGARVLEKRLQMLVSRRQAFDNRW